ncbi:GMC oxidoreductase [Zasmidium cellare ATCC 36951]|uniref:GMC oxidoreductase n=1 Tax=Zasmidium cellare ATCC 36951 TaxID=1080233 RepID=A0A6A6CP90_ZASCE|nr:GMC oxidoreductase [Zasmidium cellare ATCC 36951]KAF2167569.1 GMC oxidoreductase [Zasmidium cellare ATCC 36951]
MSPRQEKVVRILQDISSFFGVPGTNATFDYVITGGGTAGLALGVRLAAANFSVAVIEAGGFYETDNSNLSVGATDRTLLYARGKVLGGSSARNNLVYHRPTIGSLQKWADEVGEQSWNWENHLPDYKKAVNFTAPNESLYGNATNLYDASAFDSAGGPVHVSYSNFVDPFAPWARQAYIAAGLAPIAGLSSGHLLGSSYSGLLIDPTTGRRSSSEASYLQSALNARTAPSIYKNTLATEIVFDGNKAIGVAALTAGTYGTPSVNFTLSARNEVIVSAGALQSPQLPMVSGIGNCSELAAFNITCKVNLPGVGKNLWEHIDFGISHAVNFQVAGSAASNASLANDILNSYLSSASGPDAIEGTGYIGWEKLPQANRQQLSNNTGALLSSTFPSDWPEIEYLPHTEYSNGTSYGVINCALVAPLSRGTVSLASPFCLGTANRQVAVEAFKRLRTIWQGLVNTGVASPVEASPGSTVQTDAQILQFVQENLAPVWHASGTCKMGQRNDSMAVVDSNGAVFGSSGLRVVDASAFPFLPPGHPTSTVYAFAKKIADVIIQGRNETN